MARKSSREAILDAAEEVIARQGLTHTTLEAVAKEAGISKGGLLYHFANKKILLKELISRNDQMIEKKKKEIEQTLPESSMRELKAYILARIAEGTRLAPYAAKMVGVVEDEELFRLVAEIKEKQLRPFIRDPVESEVKAVFIMAMEGLWMMDLFGIAAFTPATRKKIIRRFMEMVDDYE